LSEIGRGLADGRGICCPIVGGDTNESKDMVIDVADSETPKPGDLIPRKGAQSVTLWPSQASLAILAAGLRMLTREVVEVAWFLRVGRGGCEACGEVGRGNTACEDESRTSSIDSSDWACLELE